MIATVVLEYLPDHHILTKTMWTSGQTVMMLVITTLTQTSVLPHNIAYIIHPFAYSPNSVYEIEAGLYRLAVLDSRRFVGVWR